MSNLPIPASEVGVVSGVVVLLLKAGWDVLKEVRISRNGHRHVTKGDLETYAANQMLEYKQTLENRSNAILAKIDEMKKTCNDRGERIATLEAKVEG